MNRAFNQYSILVCIMENVRTHGDFQHLIANKIVCKDESFTDYKSRTVMASDLWVVRDVLLPAHHIDSSVRQITCVPVL